MPPRHEVSASVLGESESGTARNKTTADPASSLEFTNNELDDVRLVIPFEQYDMSLTSPAQIQSCLMNDPFYSCGFDQIDSDLDIFDLSHERAPMDGIPDNSSNDIFSSNIDVSTELQNSETATFTFPDDHLLEVPSLVLLKATLQVAQRLKIDDLIWDLSANSPFYRGDTSKKFSLSSSSTAVSPSSLQTPPSTMTSDSSSTLILPYHLRPTATQTSLPHHPILDLLPWPSTRDKLIRVFNLPPQLRPKSAQSPMGLLQLVQDMENDGNEGVRVHGRDPCEACGWEIGQVMIENWWWAFDTKIVLESNQARKKRGEKALTLQAYQL